MVWIPAKGGIKYHNDHEYSEMNEPELVSQKETEDRSFTPCQKCYG